MNIVMMTNTYAPIVGGLERSIRDFAVAFRRRGHRVVIVAPAFERMPARERDVVRVPALHQRRNGMEFALKLPLSPGAMRTLVGFRPDIVHAHHPFLMGNTALRLARLCEAPLVFTHHVLFEQYVHYLPNRSETAKRFAMNLATGYANLCDLVFAPSQSVAALLRERGVRARVEVVPTGVAVGRFATGDGRACRRAMGVPATAFLVGHIGRLGPEKNLEFLAEALARFLRAEPRAHALIAGRGASEPQVRETFARAGVQKRLHMVGVLPRRQLIDAYHAMDAFAFSSLSETQGIVLVEAMAAGAPVVALDASGVREVVRDGVNGRLLAQETDAAAFAQALRELADMPPRRRRAWRAAARQTAASFSMARCARRALALYRDAIDERRFQARRSAAWRALRKVKTEWTLLRAMTRATGAALKPDRRHDALNGNGRP